VARFHLAHYIRNLTAELFRAYGVDTQRITLTSHIADVSLALDAALPCGLIVNELLSNALKHAFPHVQRGDIRIELQTGRDQQVILRVVDTGVGFPEGVDFRQTDSLGLQLVCALTEQLQGIITLERHRGSVLTVTFPLAPSAGRDSDAPRPERRSDEVR
jgi:two-component sensor histidine kinase